MLAVVPTHMYPKDPSTQKRRKAEEREAKLLMFARALKQSAKGELQLEVKLPTRVMKHLKTKKTPVEAA